MKFREDLQSFRFIAMLFVYYYHKSSKYFKGGFIGVDIFLTLSGYFITGSVMRRISKGSYYLSFYRGRILRLQPMSNIVLIVIHYISSTNIFISYKRSKEILSCLYSLANYYYYSISINYLENSSSLNFNPLLHYWSLSVENQFYLIWPLIVKYYHNNTRSFFYLFVIFFFVTLYLSYKNQSYSYFAFESRFCELIFGSFLNIIHYDNIIKYQIVYDLLIMLMWIYSNSKCSSNDYPNVKILYPLTTSFLMLIQEANKSSIFNINIFQYIGSLSYSFYIIHYPLIMYYRNISILSVLFLSFVCYSVIEIPFQNFNGNNCIVILFSICSIIIITLMQIRSYNRFIEFKNKNVKCNLMYNQDNDIASKCFVYRSYNEYEFGDMKYILLLGDSHLRQWNKVLMPIYQSTGLPSIFIIFWINYFLNDNFKVAFKIIKTIGKPKYVFECFASIPVYRTLTYIKNYKYLNLYLSNVSEKVIIIVDNPFISYNPVSIYSKIPTNYKLFCIININCTVDIQPKLKHKNIIYINLTSQFCHANVCSLYLNNMPIYGDYNHLTDCIIIHLKENFYKELKALNKDVLNKPILNKISYCYIQHIHLYLKFQISLQHYIIKIKNMSIS